MKWRRVMLTLLAITLIGSNVFVYANEIKTAPTQNEASESEEKSLAELYHQAGLDSPEVIINTLVSLGISQEEIKQAVDEDKKIYDILQEKEVPMKEFKRALNKEYRCRIRDARRAKLITRKEARLLTNLLKERMKNWEV